MKLYTVFFSHPNQKDKIEKLYISLGWGIKEWLYTTHNGKTYQTGFVFSWTKDIPPIYPSK